MLLLSVTTRKTRKGTQVIGKYLGSGRAKVRIGLGTYQTNAELKRAISSLELRPANINEMRGVTGV